MVVSEANKDVPLDRLPYIARKADASYAASVTRWRKEQGLTASRSDLIISDVPTVITLVERGAGWPVLPAICPAGFKGIVKPLYFKEGTAFTQKTHILYRAGHLELPQVRAFVEIAQNHETHSSG